MTDSWHEDIINLMSNKLSSSDSKYGWKGFKQRELKISIS